jgi:hypothetical protein
MGHLSVKQYLAVLALAATLPFAGATHAALVFVGAWDVADLRAPLWDDPFPRGPLAYTGQEAAAFLFGGNPADYTISTVDETVANINKLAWYDVIGFGGAIFAQDYSNKYLGEFYGPGDSFDGTINGAASAFVRDSLSQGVERNYAFKDDGVAVPEPSALSLLMVGLALVGAVANRRRTRQVAA